MLTVAAYAVGAELFCRACTPEATNDNILTPDDLMAGDCCAECGKEL